MPLDVGCPFSSQIRISYSIADITSYPRLPTSSSTPRKTSREANPHADPSGQLGGARQMRPPGRHAGALPPPLDVGDRRAEALDHLRELALGGDVRRREQRLVAGEAVGLGVRGGDEQPVLERDGVDG